MMSYLSSVGLVLFVASAYRCNQRCGLVREVRRQVWLLTQRLHPSEYVLSVHWTGFLTEKPLGLGLEELTFHPWIGRSRSWIDSSCFEG